jgi:prophage regulatory protein
MIKIADVRGHIPFSSTKLYEYIAAGKFPKPVHLGGSGSYWIEDEVIAWLEAHIAAERMVAKKTTFPGFRAVPSLKSRYICRYTYYFSLGAICNQQHRDLHDEPILFKVKYVREWLSLAFIELRRIEVFKLINQTSGTCSEPFCFV